MEIVGFVGPSGTGKSFRAMYVANKNKIPYIIDDGLLINAKGVAAGYSAKKESTKVASVKRAIFTNKDHAAEVSDAIRRYKPPAILILGTSDAMVERIVDALKLPPVSRIIRIEEIATPEEMANAKRIRTEQGKHVIPVPTFAIKKDFSGYFMDSLKVFLKNGKSKDFLAEKTIVRPTFSYLGDYHISNRVIVDICYYETARVADIARVIKVNVDTTGTGVRIHIDAVLRYGRPFPQVADAVYTAIIHSVEELTAINVDKITLHIKGLEMADAAD